VEIKIKSDDFSRGETTSGFVYGEFNVAAPNLLESANAFRYETQSGFVVETRNNVLPFFNADDRSLYWHDFTVAPPVASLAEFYSFPIRQSVSTQRRTSSQ
jgi:hypothetical protein